MRKKVTFLMVLVLLTAVMTGGPGVYADTLTGAQPDKGTLTIYKTDGSKPLAGAEFTLYKIMELTPGTSPGEFSDYSIVEHYQTALEQVTPDMLGNYDAVEIEAAAEAVLSFTAADSAGIKTPATNEAGKTSVELELGYYIVVETGTPHGYVAGSPFFVSIPSTNNYNNSSVGTAWTYEVEAEPKNESVPLQKHIITGQDETGTSSASVGADIFYVVDTIVPTFADEYFAGNNVPIFRLTDTMSEGLKFNDDITVYLVNSDGTETEVPSGTGTWRKTTGNDVDFIVIFFRPFMEANRGTAIRVYYSAELTEDAVIGTADGENVNEVTLEYSNNPQNIADYDSQNDDTRVYSFAVKVEKFTETDEEQTALKGAVFGLYTDQECKQAALEQEIFTTDINGIAEFKGLKAGTYYLMEVKAPAGYELLKEPVKLEIRAVYGDDGELTGEFEFYVADGQVTAVDGVFLTRYDLESGTAIVAVKNQERYVLPLMGGLGSYPLLVLGVICVVISAAMFRKYKKSRAV